MKNMSHHKSLIQEDQTLCQFCERKIVTTNHQLHEARCSMMSSRVRNQQYKNQVQRQEKPSHMRKVSFNKPAISSRVVLGSEIANLGRQRIFNQPKRQEQMAQQLIPCSNCGYMQTFAQLDTHPKECAHQEYECSYCKHSFPSILKEQHDQYCQAKQEQVHHQPPINRYHRPHIHHIESDQEPQIEEDLGHNHYFSNWNNQRRQMPMANVPRIVQRTSTTINGRTVVQETDQFGNVRRREFQNGNINGNEHYHHHPIRSFSLEPFGNSERAGIFGNRGNPFADFFRLLQNFASHGQQNQGLTKQQIKNLQKQKYKRPLEKPQNEQKDLCTICYCEFQQAQQIVKLRCKHLYHEQCIVKWLQSNAKCPVCKAPQTNRQILNEDD